MNTNDNRLKAHKLIDHIFQDLLPAHGMAQRPEQIQLSHRMLEAMQDGRIALCDAGTGIGKTYAYLAAATAASAFPTGQIARPIIISTSSIALQNAVLTEYLPPVQPLVADIMAFAFADDRFQWLGKNPVRH